MNKESLVKSVLRHRLTPPAFILVFFFMLYARSLPYPFLNYDDDMYLYDNPLVTNFDISKIPLIFSTEQQANFSPMVTLSFALEHKIWGLNPGGYRLGSFILHSGTILLLYLLILRLFSDKILAALVTLMFAVHPLRIEALVWLSSRKDSLFGFFLLLTLNLYLSYLRRRKNSHYLFSLLSLSVALLAKVTAMIALPLLLLIDWREKRKFDRALILDKIPFALVILLLGLTNTSMLLNSKYGVHQGWAKLPLAASGSLAFLVVRFFWPFHLSVHYPDCIDEFLVPWWFFLLLTVLFFAGTGFLLRWGKKWLWGILFILMTLFPVWMFMLRSYPMADRFTYLPSIGVGLLTVASLRQLFGRIVGKRLRIGAGVLVLGLLLSIWGTAHICYLPVWRDNMIFWTDQIAKFPRIHQNYNSRAVLFKKAGQYEQAIRDLDRAIELYPYYAGAHWNRGLCYNNLEQFDKAENDFLKCVMLDPDFFHRLITAVQAGAIRNGFALALRAGHLLEAKGFHFVSEPVFPYIMAYLNAREKNWQVAEAYIEKALSAEENNKQYLELRKQIRSRSVK